MKIDFLGKYSEIAKLIRHSSVEEKTLSKGEKFSSLMDAIPGKNQIKSNSFEPIQEKIGLSNDYMGRLNFESPSLISPEINDSKAESGSGDSVAPSVKKPTIFDITRVPSGSELSKMPKSERVAHVKSIVEGVGQRVGIDPDLGMAVADAESSFNPLAISKDGHYSKGLFQLLDSTGKGMMKEIEREDNYDPFDPKQNVELGLNYLRYLHDIFTVPTKLGDKLTTVAAANSTELEKLAVAAYNAGEGRVAAAQVLAQKSGKDPTVYKNIEGYLPDITQRYVARVTTIKGSH